MHFGAMIMIYVRVRRECHVEPHPRPGEDEGKEKDEEKCKILQLSDLIYGFRVGGKLGTWKKRYETEIFRFETLFALGHR